MTSTEGNTMFTLAVYTTISAGLLLWLLVRWARDRWVAAGEKVDRLADLGEPCAQCQPGGRPPCVCTSDCGASGCVGDHTGLALLTPEDMKILRGIERGGAARRRPWQRGRKKAGTR